MNVNVFLIVYEKRKIYNALGLFRIRNFRVIVMYINVREAEEFCPMGDNLSHVYISQRSRRKKFRSLIEIKGEKELLETFPPPQSGEKKKAERRHKEAHRDRMTNCRRVKKTREETKMTRRGGKTKSHTDRQKNTQINIDGHMKTHEYTTEQI